MINELDEKEWLRLKHDDFCEYKKNFGHVLLGFIVLLIMFLFACLWPNNCRMGE